VSEVKPSLTLDVKFQPSKFKDENIPIMEKKVLETYFEEVRKRGGLSIFVNRIFLPSTKIEIDLVNIAVLEVAWLTLYAAIKQGKYVRYINVNKYSDKVNKVLGTCYVCWCIVSKTK